LKIDIEHLYDIMTRMEQLVYREDVLRDIAGEIPEDLGV